MKLFTGRVSPSRSGAHLGPDTADRHVELLIVGRPTGQRWLPLICPASGCPAPQLSPSTLSGQRRSARVTMGQADPPLLLSARVRAYLPLTAEASYDGWASVPTNRGFRVRSGAPGPSAPAHDR